MKIIHADTRQARVRFSATDRGTSTASFTTRLTFDTQVSPRNRLESGHWDSIAAHFAIAVFVGIDTRERLLDFFDSLARGIRQRDITFAFDGQRVTLSAFFIELRVTRFTLVRDLFGFGHQRVGLGVVMIAFFEELSFEFFERARREWCSMVLRRFGVFDQSDRCGHGFNGRFFDHRFGFHSFRRDDGGTLCRGR